MAVTANQRIKAQSPGRLRSHPVVASKHLYAGTIAYLTAGGYMTDVIAAGANVFAGIVKAEVDNSAGASGDLTAEVWTQGDFELTGSGLTQADEGDLMYGVDNYAFNATATAQSLIGRLARYISATKGVIAIDPDQT